MRFIYSSFTSEKTADCLWDTWAHDKVENGRIQNSVININQQFSVHRDIKEKTSDNILVLYQQYRSSPGGLISDCERSKPVDIETDKNYKFNFLDTIHSQSYESKEESTSFKDWSVRHVVEVQQKSVDHVVLGTTVKHGMSDWVVGSNIKHNNNYHIKEHNKVSEKVIYLNSKNPFAQFYNHESFTNNITINH
ncbi:hypothetical protein ACTFIR_009143 [Dictyostelium discoideum]